MPRKMYSPVGITVFSPLPSVKQIVAQMLGVLHPLKNVSQIFHSELKKMPLGIKALERFTKKPQSTKKRKNSF